MRHLHLNDVIDGIDHQEIGTGVLDFDEMEPLNLPRPRHRLRYA